MVSANQATKWALSIPGVEELPHFHKSSFRVKKKIFATLDVGKKLLMVKLNEIDQSVFCYDKAVIYPVPGAWGKQGCTYIELARVKKTVCKAAIETAYKSLVNKKMR